MHAWMMPACEKSVRVASCMHTHMIVYIKSAHTCTPACEKSVRVASSYSTTGCAKSHAPGERVWEGVGRCEKACEGVRRCEEA